MQYVNNYAQQFPSLQQGYANYNQYPNLMNNFNNYVQQNNFVGKIVDSVEVVKATDIPMDGNTYYFPKADGTEIYGKRWLQNGSTEIISYKRVFEQDSPEPNVEGNKIDLVTVMSRFDKIDERFDKLEKNLYPKQQMQSKRKESVNE